MRKQMLRKVYNYADCGHKAAGSTLDKAAEFDVWLFLFGQLQFVPRNPPPKLRMCCGSVSLRRISTWP